jgi:hypothetical protein
MRTAHAQQSPPSSKSEFHRRRCSLKAEILDRSSGGGRLSPVEFDRLRGPEGRDREGDGFGEDAPTGVSVVGGVTVISWVTLCRLMRSGCETAFTRGQSPRGGGDGG